MLCLTTSVCWEISGSSNCFIEGKGWTCKGSHLCSAANRLTYTNRRGGRCCVRFGEDLELEEVWSQQKARVFREERGAAPSFELLLHAVFVEQPWLSFMELDKGFGEDSIPWEELRCSNALQGKVAMRWERGTAHAGSYEIFPPARSILASMLPNLQRSQLPLLERENKLHELWGCSDQFFMEQSVVTPLAK